MGFWDEGLGFRDEGLGMKGFKDEGVWIKEFRMGACWGTGVLYLVSFEDSASNQASYEGVRSIEPRTCSGVCSLLPTAIAYL